MRPARPRPGPERLIYPNKAKSEEQPPILRLADYGDSPTLPETALARVESLAPVESVGALESGSLGSELAGSPGLAGLLRELQGLREQNGQLRAEVRQLRERESAVRREVGRLDEEMRLAARLQRDFLPRRLPTLGKLRCHVLFRPAGYVSGDIYDAARLDERHIGFYVADAVGHGVPAALLTMFIRQALQLKEISDNSYRLVRPGEALARLNAALVRQDLSEATFATCLCGLVNAESGEMLLANGGHPKPLLLPAQGEVTALECEGSLLGIFEGEAFADIRYELKEGDRLIVFSDGVDVAFRRGPGDEKTFDAERWREELLRSRHEPTDVMLGQLARSLDGASGSLDPGDDLTILVLEWGGPRVGSG